MKNIIAILSLLLISRFQVIGQSTFFTTNQQADLMVSGLDFNQTGGALTFNHPNGLASNGTNLLMCDRFNNRLLIWQTAPTVWNQLPDLVLGQVDFNSNDPGTAKDKMNWPGNVSIGGNGKIAVADTDNDRLLFWNSFPTTNGTPANVSIHLPTISPTGIQQRWEWPWGIWTDGTRVAAVATMGRTLLFWNSFPTIDNQQPDYTITHSNFGTPRNISTDGSSYFFVGDHNSVVANGAGTFFWNSYPNTANQAYDFHRTEWIKGAKLLNGKLIAGGLNAIYTWDSVPNAANQNPVLTARPTCYDNGDGVDVVEANNKIYVCNYNGNDVLVYNTPPDSISPNPVFALGVSNFNNNILDSIGYIQNPAFSSDGTRLIITSDYDKRIYIYNTFPTVSGQMADQVISTSSFNLSPWDNALHNNTFAAVGKNSVCIWDVASNLAQNPSRIYSNTIGTATFNDLKGVALDSTFFYVADRGGKVYLWNGIPLSGSVNPDYTLNYGNVDLNRLSSDGTYFCVTQQSPPSIYIYKVADLASGNTNPWKTIDSIGLMNLPAEAITFNGAFAIANQSFDDVLIWEDINLAPSPAAMVILGQANNSANNNPAIGQNRLFMPGALLFENNNLWVGEFKFSSRILKFAASPTSLRELENRSFNFNIFPNPLNETSQLSVQLDENAKVSIQLWNALGQKVKSIQEENFMLKGSFSISIPLGEIASGVYFIQAIVNEESAFCKMVKP